MTDTRCADPRYQLDVDVMMLEYTVYKAIESQIENLRFQIEDLDSFAVDGYGPTSAAEEKQKQSAILQQTCDHLITLFRHHHPETAFSGSCEYNLSILEFLVLLEHWINRSSRTILGPESSWELPGENRPEFCCPPPLPKSLVQRFQQERTVETVLRRNWLGIRYDNNASTNPKVNGRKQYHNTADDDHEMIDNDDDDDSSRDSTGRGNMFGTQSSRRPRIAELDPPNEELCCLNAGTTSGLRRNQRLEPAVRSNQIKDLIRNESLFSITLFELTPRFMELSADIADVMGPVNERWINLASQLLWQSALERLQQMPDTRYASTPSNSTGQDFSMRVWVEECFAWGLIDDPSSTPLNRIKRELHYLGPTQESDDFIEQRLHTEDRMARMFRHTTNDQDDDNNDSNDESDTFKNEISKWTSTRQTQLQKLLNLKTTNPASSSSSTRDSASLNQSVQDLCEQSPIRPFVSALVDYIEGLFTINANSDISGQPILVQIEQGKLEGLNDVEFKTFLDRVGLKVSSILPKTHSRHSDGAKRVRVVKWAK